MFRKIFAFMKRDFLVSSSYRLAFCVELIYAVTSILIFFFISRLFDGRPLPILKEYGGDYFSFVIVGMAFSSYLAWALSSFSQALSYEQGAGTLELLLLSPNKIHMLFFYSSAVNFILVTIKVVFYLVVGIFFFNLKIYSIDFLALFLLLGLAIAVFCSIGIFSVSFIIIFKRADPINMGIWGLSKLLGGVYFPITIMPLWLKNISLFLPITYALSGVRKIVLAQASFPDLIIDFTVLALFCLILLPLSLLCLNRAIDYAKKRANLMYS